MNRIVLRVLLLVLGIGLVTAGVTFWKLSPRARAIAATRIKLIDDFDGAQEQNLVGGIPFSSASAGARLNPALLRVPTPAPGELALALTYELPHGSSAVWGTGLNELDISAATALRFWIKADRLPLPALSVELVDDLGGKAQVALRGVRSNTHWQLVSISTSAFHGVDFNRLARFILHITAPSSSLQGTLYMDELLFFGPPSVFFRSLEDNLYAYPRQALVDPRRLLGLPQEQRLRGIAEDTWGYFRDLVDRRHHLPMNYIQTKPVPLIGDYASTTDTSMYLMSVVSAADLGFIDHAEARSRIRATLEQLAKLPRWRGFFYNYYSTTNLQITNQYISSVDNGWLAVALIVVRQAVPELAQLASSLMQPMDFSVFYDPLNGQMRLGYEVEKGRFAPYHYGLLSTEARIISLVAIGKGDVPEDHWFRIYRTLPKEWAWQRQPPLGQLKRYRGHEVFDGYYTYDDKGRQTPFVPSWGGSLFEFLMPTLVVDERRLAPHGLGLNDQRAVDIHMRYALQDRGYPVWGLSPCATPKERYGGYSEFGIAALGSKGYKDEAIVTPHVSMLALGFAPEAVEKNVREFLRRYKMYGPYGFYDAVDVTSGDVAYRYLALDQGMSLIALDNYLNDGAIQRWFSADPIMQRVEWLLREEHFFDAAAAAPSQ